MTITGHRHSTDEKIVGLTPEQASSSSVLDAIFELFHDDAMLLVELDAHSRIVKCNSGYMTACGRTNAQLTHAFPPDLFTIQILNPPGVSKAVNITTDSYRYSKEEEWDCTPKRWRTIVRWLKLWTFQVMDETRFVKLGTWNIESHESVNDYVDDRVRLQTFLDASPDAVITINEQGAMASVNPATERLFGYERAELIGRNVSMLMPRPDRDRHDEYIDHYLRTGEARIMGTSRDIVAQRSDGTTFPARLTVSEFTAHGKRFLTGMLQDITERVKTEERQRENFIEHAHVSRVVALGETASSIAHEINQPLTAIVSFADASRKLIATDHYEREPLDHALQQISKQGQRTGEIIRRLREFVKKKEPTRSSCDINEVINSAVAFTSHDIERFGITLKPDFHSNPLMAQVDRLQIEQVVLNLIRNSLDAITESERQDGTIAIRSHLENESIVVSITDNGIGIKPSEIINVFDTFYTTKEKGTGLGLSISHSIAEAHGGTLTLQPNKGSGVTFILTLPTHTDE